MAVFRTEYFSTHFFFFSFFYKVEQAKDVKDRLCSFLGSSRRGYFTHCFELLFFFHSKRDVQKRKKKKTFLSAGGFMFEGMSDDEEDFQSVSHAAWSLSRSAWVTRRRRRSSKCPFSACECLLTGEPSGPLQPSGRLSGHAAHIAEPQRGGGASADHAERAGDGSGSRQHSRQQCGHAYNVQPGENRGVWRTDGGSIFPLPNVSAFAQRSHVVPLFLPLGPLIQGDSSNNAAPMPAGTPVSNDLFSQALQQALQASNMSALQVRPQIRSWTFNPQRDLDPPVFFIYLFFFPITLKDSFSTLLKKTLTSSSSGACACLKAVFREDAFVLLGPLAVPDAAAQGHGDPGWGADAEGAAGHRWWHPGCPGAHFCWRPRTLRPQTPTAEGFVERRAQKDSLAAAMIHTLISYTIRVHIYKFNKVFVHIYMCFYF